MSEVKNFVLIKTTPGEVFFTIPSITNPGLQREIYLTNKHPQQPMPAEWALSIIAEPSLYLMYRKGLITFNDNEGLAKLAYEQGYLFDEKYDFKPSSKEDETIIYAALKAGTRAKIEESIQTYGADRVREVAIAHLGTLTQNVIQVLEKTFGVQLVMDNVAEIGE